MRRVLLSAAIATLMVACSPPASQQRSETPETPAPEVAACNTVAPDHARQVAVSDAEAVAAAAADLRGGELAPGVYDLIRATRIGSPTGWQSTQAVALQVSEAANGAVTLNWAGAPLQGQVDRWTADFSEQSASIAFTCGRIGTVEADFQASGSALQLRLPDGANGALLLDFERRA